MFKFMSQEQYWSILYVGIGLNSYTHKTCTMYIGIDIDKSYSKQGFIISLH